MAATKEEIKELAEHIYDLDAEVYVHLGSSLGRVFNRDRERCVNELTELLTTRSDISFRIVAELSFRSEYLEIVLDPAAPMVITNGSTKRSTSSDFFAFRNPFSYT